MSAQLLDPRQMANHPEMAAVLSEEDEDMLSYMTNLKVRPALPGFSLGRAEWRQEGAGGESSALGLGTEVSVG